MLIWEDNEHRGCVARNAVDEYQRFRFTEMSVEQAPCRCTYGKGWNPEKNWV
jgi:hypothetical protein